MVAASETCPRQSSYLFLDELTNPKINEDMSFESQAVQYILRFYIVVDKFEGMEESEVLKKLDIGLRTKGEVFSGFHKKLDTVGVADNVESKSRLNT
jgi:hypothetical protein